MQPPVLSYHGYRFPPDHQSGYVALCHRSCVSLRDVEDLLAQRGIIVSYETIGRLCGSTAGHGQRLGYHATHRTVIPSVVHSTTQCEVGLIRSRGHVPKGGYDVPNGSNHTSAVTPAIQ